MAKKAITNKILIETKRSRSMVAIMDEYRGVSFVLHPSSDGRQAESLFYSYCVTVRKRVIR
jgi:hypothetical protein